jgi:DNA-binding beta-propeller fold protein YncE
VTTAVRERWLEALRCGAIALALMAAEAAVANSYILVAGRRDPRIYAIDLEAALRQENNNTPNAIVSRSLVGPRRLDGALLGDPANIVLSADQRTAYVMNHHGSIVNAEFLQHGGRANISIMAVDKMVRRELDDTDKAVEKVVDAGWFGGVGLIALGDRLITSSSEGWLAVDGSNRISIIDIASGALVGQIEMALTGPGTRQLKADCAAFPVPFKSPTPPATTYAFQGPSRDFGCWPNPQFIAIGHGSDGKRYLVSGNGGTHDVSIMDLEKALAGAPVVEVAPRVPIQAGPFGIAASPDGRLIAVTSRQNNIAGIDGNTISLIDVDLARQGLPGAERARVLVGADQPDQPTRPFSVAWTPDGRVVVANFRTNSVSVVDVRMALAGQGGAEVARIGLDRPDGAPARPKIVAVTRDGRYAVVTGGDDTLAASTTRATGMAYVIDLRTLSVVAQVTGVGIDPYGVTVVEDAE